MERMKTKKTLFLFCLFAALAVSIPSRIEPTQVVKAQSISSDVLVGVEIAYDNIGDCKMMVDKVKNYTNLFVIGTTDITLNETSLNIVCDYVYNAVACACRMPDYRSIFDSCLMQAFQ